MRRLLIIVGPNRYQVLNHYATQLARGFERLGWEVTLFFSSDGNQFRFHPRLFDLVISPNGEASMARLNNDLLFDQKGVPQIAWMVDDPLHTHLRFKIGARLARYTCVDADHLPSARSLLGESTLVDFCPLGASKLAWEGEERPIDLLLCGSHRTLVEPLKSHLLLIQRLEAELQGEPRSALQIVEEWFHRPLVWESPLEVALASSVDVYLRGRRREIVLDRLADAGLVVDLYGEGWERTEQGRSHRVHKPVDVEEAIRLLGRARVVIDTPSNFGFGPHDRTLTAPLAGAVPVTYWNRYYQERFKEGEELVGYRWSQIDELGDRISLLLADEKRRLEIARAGGERVAASELWWHRAETMERIIFG